MSCFKELGPNIYGEAEVPSRAGTPSLSQGHPMLSVVDVDAAIGHYRTALGFFVEWAMRGENGSTTIPWGAYEMRVADLDGNEFRFACAAKSG